MIAIKFAELNYADPSQRWLMRALIDSASPVIGRMLEPCDVWRDIALGPVRRGRDLG